MKLSETDNKTAFIDDLMQLFPASHDNRGMLIVKILMMDGFRITHPDNKILSDYLNKHLDSIIRIYRGLQNTKKKHVPSEEVKQARKHRQQYMKIKHNSVIDMERIE